MNYLKLETTNWLVSVNLLKWNWVLFHAYDETHICTFENNNTCVIILFVDFSSALNTISTMKLFGKEKKKKKLGLCTTHGNWILDLFTKGPQTVQIGSHTSSTAVLNIGAPEL